MRDRRNSLTATRPILLSLGNYFPIPPGMVVAIALAAKLFA